MRKACYIVFITILLMTISSVGMAKDLTGVFGIGYFNNDAPVGFRYWVNDKLGLDVGVGLESQDVWWWNDEADDMEKQSALSFWFEVGVPYVVYPSDRANFFVRPGILFASLDDRVYGWSEADAKWTRIILSVTPGVEVFFGDNFSLEAGHGIAIDMLSYPDEEEFGDRRRGKTMTSIRTFDASVTYLGFHFYFH